MNKAGIVTWARVMSWGVLLFVVAGSGRLWADVSAPLFRDVVSIQAADMAQVYRGQPGIKRVRMVTLDQGWLNQQAAATKAGGPAGAVTLNLFGDVQLHMDVAERAVLASGAVKLAGPLGQGKQGRAMLVSSQGYLSGLIETEQQGSFAIYSGPDGLHSVVELDPETMPGCGADVVAEESHGASCCPEHAVMSNAETVDTSVWTQVETGGGSVVSEASGDLPVLDLLVVYTTASRIAAGGTNGILSVIELSIAQMNEILGNSQVDMRVRLVHAAEVSYDEPFSYSSSLSDLRVGNGALGVAHQLRETYGADAVAMIREYGDYAGIAYVMGNPNNNFSGFAFSVTGRAYAYGNKTFTHELGHNLGCHHDPANAGSAFYPYAYGHRFDANNITYRTVMAYSPGTRINYFSTPQVSFGGVPVGVQGAADNARAINSNRWAAVNWRSAVNQPPVANAGADQTVGLAGATLSLNGGGSVDPDGTIVGYAWRQLAGPSVTVGQSSTNMPTASVVIPARASTAEYTFELVVTDNDGLTASDTLTVSQRDASYLKTFDQVFSRGTANGWGTTEMTLVSNYVWETTATFGGGSSERFKFDVHGDWSLNFGDNNNDGIAEQDGNDIFITGGAGSYLLRFHDQSRRYWVQKIHINQPPVADAGPDRTTYQMESVVLDGSGSYDPDGTIASFAWSVAAGGNPGPINMTDTTTATPTVQWGAPALSNRLAIIQLVVTDNDGASATSLVHVTQTSALIFEKTYPQVYFRGTANGWATTGMTLVSNYVWETTAIFGSGSSERFKLDVHGDWSLNFGDNHSDGIAEQNGNDIFVTQGEGTYTLRFHDQSKRYWVHKVHVNQPPVAHPGPNRTVPLAGGSVTLDGSGSYDPDGTIVSYSWTQLAGPAAVVTHSGPGNSIAAAQIPARASAETYAFRLTVTDDEGAMTSATMTVQQQPASLLKTYDQVFFRGSANGWGTTAMALVSNYVWETTATFGGGAGERFKLDVYGDWSLNFGDNNNDGMAEQSGADIAITQGTGTYLIRFNDQTRHYTVRKEGAGFLTQYTSMTVAGTFNGWNPSANNMQLVGDYTWRYDVVLLSGVEFKITANGGWAQNWGEANQGSTTLPVSGAADAGAANIRVTGSLSGTYRITFNEQTRAYSVTTATADVLVGHGDELPRVLTPWERYYQIDLLEGLRWQEDPDLDGLINLDEMYADTNPYLADTDGDGMNDREEVLAGTEPRNASDYLHVNVLLSADQGFRLGWQAVPARAYVVQGAAAPDQGWTNLGVIAPVLADRTWIDVPAAVWQDQGYILFRLAVETAD